MFAMYFQGCNLGIPTKAHALARDLWQIPCEMQLFCKGFHRTPRRFFEGPSLGLLMKSIAFCNGSQILNFHSANCVTPLIEAYHLSPAISAPLSQLSPPQPGQPSSASSAYPANPSSARPALLSQPTHFSQPEP